MLNDYTYTSTPAYADDSRWVHRPAFDAGRWAQRLQPGSIPERIYRPIQQMVGTRKALSIFDATNQTEWVALDNPHLVAVRRFQPGSQLLILANFSEVSQILRFNAQIAVSTRVVDVLTHTPYDLSQPLDLPAYGQRWLYAEYLIEY